MVGKLQLVVMVQPEAMVAAVAAAAPEDHAIAIVFVAGIMTFMKVLPEAVVVPEGWRCRRKWWQSGGASFGLVLQYATGIVDNTVKITGGAGGNGGAGGSGNLGGTGGTGGSAQEGQRCMQRYREARAAMMVVPEVPGASGGGAGEMEGLQHALPW